MASQSLVGDKKLSFSVLSPAKINLMLRILGRRVDGYHSLQTCFQLLDWGDTIRFEGTVSKSIRVEGDFHGLAEKDNLIYQAAKKIWTYANSNLSGVRIVVKKRIPQGAGLGGGSSNAATALKILNQLWSCGLSHEQLMQVGLKLGADVPLFIFGKSAVATGIGEVLRERKFRSRYYVLYLLDCMVATAEVFSAHDLIRDQKKIPDDQLDDPAYWSNGCLSVVMNMYPKVKKAYDMISQFYPVYLSGTGATLFSAFNDKEAALACVEKCSMYCHSTKLVGVLD